MLGHDLRAPLNAILGWTERLQSEELDEGRRERALETIARNARTQHVLIEQILDAARVSADLELVLAPIDLGPVIERVVEGFLPAASERRIELLCCALDGIMVMADRERIQQVVTNLVGNALKFAEAGGHVSVSLQRASGRAQLVVRVAGQGIDAALLPRVFDSLRARCDRARCAERPRPRASHREDDRERHGGAVAAESDGPGRGATFTVRLPLHAGAISGTREKTTI